ncbi:porin [Celeribacter halophilus]|uniref:Porin n=1 Tax=Celeribacter halophilus TaxID=576117 RepID=A0A1I3SZU4_9RHOB|nr:porin [Celeribacter halophilus]PZX11998.1 porin-like protein [Celeribacter halophilus]SFJ64195.1 porin [Celeribacter halophilus]
MKNILLSSAAIALLAGAASAEVTWSGDAEIGYNDDFEDGVYWDAGLYVNMSQELNNGWTASASLDIDLEDSSQGSTYSLGDVDSSDWVVTLSNDMFSLSFGDVDTAMASFDYVTGLFAATDAIDDAIGIDSLSDDSSDYAAWVGTPDAGILISATYGQFSGAYSALSVDGELGAQQLFLGGDFDVVEVGFFYQEEDTDYAIATEQYALTVSGSFAGFEVTGSYGQTDYFGFGDGSAYGIEVAYPIGAVTLGAYYTGYDVDGADVDGAYGISVDYADGPVTVSAYYGSGLMYDGTNILDDGKEYGIEGAYDFGMGLVVTAGYIDGDDETDDDLATYIVAEYDLGGGASFLASYADANSTAAASTDDIDTGVNGYELYSGATMALSFEF